MAKEKKNTIKKVRKTVNVAGVIIKIVLILVGVAVLAFLVWLGVSILQMFVL